MRYLPVFLIVFIAVSGASSQTRQKAVRPTTTALIKQLSSKDESQVERASKALIARGRSVITPLGTRLKTNKLCEFKFAAAEVIRKIAPEHTLVITTLWDVARGECEYRYSPEKYLPDANFGGIMAQWRAADILASKVNGGAVLVFELLNNPLGIYSFTFALPAIIEKLTGTAQPAGKPVDPDLVRAARAAIPKLAPFLDAEGRRLRCDVYDALRFFQSSTHEELRAEAERVLEGKVADCTS